MLHRPSTAAGLHLAAAAAHGARVFAGDRAYARRLLEAATTAYRAAQAEPELRAPDDHGAFGGGPYAHDDLAGDWAWAAAELWLATRDAAYAAMAARTAGAVAGGPTSNEHPGFPTDPRLRGLPPQRCYLDEPTSETTNDVCIRWNAPLVHMAAFLSPAPERRGR